MKKLTRLSTPGGRILLTSLALLISCCVGEPLYADVLHWEVTGRVDDVSDPDGIYGPIAIDDPVLGQFSYDTTLEPDYFFGLAFYLGDSSPNGPLLIINPGEAGELALTTPASGGAKRSAGWITTSPLM